MENTPSKLAKIVTGSALLLLLNIACSKNLMNSDSMAKSDLIREPVAPSNEIRGGFLEANIGDFVVKLPAKGANAMDIREFNVNYNGSQITVIEVVDASEKVRGQINITGNKNNDSFSFKIALDGPSRNGTAKMDRLGNIVANSISGDLALLNTSERQVFDVYLNSVKK